MRRRRCPPAIRRAGVTLVELMVSMAIGMLVVLAASALLVAAKTAYVTQSDRALVLDTGRYALDIIRRTVRQAALSDWDLAWETAVEAGVLGIDARSLKATTEGISAPVPKSVNGSDILAVRFSGAGVSDDGDGSVLNCAGFGVGSKAATGVDRGWSIFYVAADSSGEPELYCKYRGEDGWTAQAIARGVESFQVLYALDADGDGAPDTVVNASAIDAMDGALTLSGRNAAERLAELRRKSWWRKVAGVRVALLVRGAHPVAADKSALWFDLFGKAYSDRYASRDPGVRVFVSDLPKGVRNNVRRVFTAAIRLRNAPGDE
ncbi:MAG TPA: PilW family protein [Noviherbaspirillum sp.]|uniref:PilW family protein n=1 Tax=Noviherbaspirillum sp. TaxID=1926288 RepID=UPI002D41B751|nr:PilW family protein [Noviherbaspirillum sp.]HYD97188.1 PilW family protein [Noviherbaspirillum sp.]